MKKILKYFIIFLAFIGVIISISRPTSAKYFALEFGDIWDVKFSKFSTYAAEFVVGDETKKTDSDNVYWQSGNLWGAGEPENQNQNLNNWTEADAYRINNLQEVAFSAKNITDHDVMIIFEIDIYFFKNSDILMNFIVQNTSSNAYQNLRGGIDINGKTVTSKHFINGNYSELRNYYKSTFIFNPYEYYKKVELENKQLNFGDTDNSGVLSENEYNAFSSINASAPNEAYEKPSLEECFILSKNEKAEFNISVFDQTGKGCTDKSVYSKITMKAIVSPYSTSA